MTGHRHSNALLLELVRVVNQVDRKADFEIFSRTFEEKAIPEHGLPKGFKIDMYGNEPDYKDAHVRVRYKGGDGNYAISDGRRLNGGIEKKYESEIQAWIAERKQFLKECWNEIKDSLKGIRSSTAWWGSVDWENDLEDESSPASCRLIIIPANHANFRRCIDGEIELPSSLVLPSARFIGFADGSLLCVGLLNRTDRLTINGCRQIKLLDEFEGGAFASELYWMDHNDLPSLVSTLPGLTFATLLDLGEKL